MVRWPLHLGRGKEICSQAVGMLLDYCLTPGKMLKALAGVHQLQAALRVHLGRGTLDVVCTRSSTL
jgi:hypothetical protein